MLRTFVALSLPDTLRDRLALVQQFLPLPSRIDPAEFHLTLAFLGEQPEPVLEAVHDALSGLEGRPFSLSLRGMGLFGGGKPRVLWAGLAPSAPLLALQARVAQAVRRGGVDLARHRFVPHVTLGRFPPPGPEVTMRLEAAVAGMADFTVGPWEVRGFGLFASFPARKGPRYDLLADYPLSD
jgi:2'-5' RNA ligase